MLYLPNDEMFTNTFVHCELPTKAQIFSRTGQRSVAPNGVYTQDKSYMFDKSPTQSAMEFIKEAESFQSVDESKSE